jgi:hypothetical protein
VAQQLLHDPGAPSGEDRGLGAFGHSVLLPEKSACNLLSEERVINDAFCRWSLTKADREKNAPAPGRSRTKLGAELYAARSGDLKPYKCRFCAWWHPTRTIR